MNNIDIDTVREELVQALSKEFDDSKGLAIYGAGDTAERWFTSFLEGETIPDCVPDCLLMIPQKGKDQRFAGNL